MKKIKLWKPFIGDKPNILLNSIFTMLIILILLLSI